VPDVTRFAGYASPEMLLEDPWLSRDDKISGLRTWRGLIVRFGMIDDAPEVDEQRMRVQLVDDIDRALECLATSAPERASDLMRR
jgi:hypothetical protein